MEYIDYFKTLQRQQSSIIKTSPPYVQTTRIQEPGTNKEQEILAMIHSILVQRKNEEILTQYLEGQAEGEDKLILHNINEDERLQDEALKELYRKWSKGPLPKIEVDESENLGNTYVESLRNTFFSRLETLQSYRNLYLLLPEQEQQALFGIIIDKLIYIEAFQYMLAKARNG